MRYNSRSRTRFSGSRWHKNNSRSGGSFGDQSAKYIKKAEVIESETEAPYVAQNKFSDFNIHQTLKINIETHGYTIPTPIQDQTIPHLLDGRDVVGIANTGTGKTAAFLIPAINKVVANPQEKVLIIAPTRELAIQIDDEFRAFARGTNIYSELCIGGASINRQIDSIRKNPNFIIGTPGRLKDLVNRRVLNLGQFRTIVLDEVDRMLDIGFIHEIKYLVSLLPEARQSLFFSATVSREIDGIIHSFLRDPIHVSVKTKETAHNIEQDVIRVRSKEEKLSKLNELLHQEEFKKVIIFGRTKWTVERLARTLQDYGFTAESIHGNKSQNQRQRALDMFKRDRLKILVATDIAARGLDINDVTHVINFDEPASFDDYVHRIGRTGRANKAGKALTFVS
jgi:ATP-dependent RNA helicase RhlE